MLKNGFSSKVYDGRHVRSLRQDREFFGNIFASRSIKQGMLLKGTGNGMEWKKNFGMEY